eukprot:951480-Pelagomonas_calceolata.AAC.1
MSGMQAQHRGSARDLRVTMVTKGFDLQPGSLATRPAQLLQLGVELHKKYPRVWEYYDKSHSFASARN